MNLGKLLIGIVALVLICYLSVCALMYFQQRRLLYLPQYTRIASQYTDFTLKRGSLTLRGWLLHPGLTDAVIYFGGNAEQIGSNAEDFDRWMPNKSVYLLAYRGYGASDGTPNETDLVADAVALYDDVQRRHPHGKIAVIGRSLGSGVASALAAQRDIDRLLLVTPFDSLLNTAREHFPWLPVNLLLQDRWNSVDRLRSFKKPILILRASRDQVVPPARTHQLVASLHNNPYVEVVEFSDASHDTIQSSPGYAKAFSNFLR